MGTRVVFPGWMSQRMDEYGLLASLDIFKGQTRKVNLFLIKMCLIHLTQAFTVCQQRNMQSYSYDEDQESTGCVCHPFYPLSTSFLPPNPHRHCPMVGRLSKGRRMGVYWMVPQLESFQEDELSWQRETSFPPSWDVPPQLLFTTHDTISMSELNCFSN